MLAVVVIAVGLTMISQAIGSSLTTVRRLREIQEQLTVAELLLHRLEVEAQQWGASAPRDGAAEPPDERYAWELDTVPATTEQREALYGGMVTAVLTVRPADERYAATVLQALWPSTWIK